MQTKPWTPVLILYNQVVGKEEQPVGDIDVAHTAVEVEGKEVKPGEERPQTPFHTAGDDVVVEKQKVTNKQITYQLSAAQLAQFKNSAGDGYTFKVVHSDDTYVQAAILDKQ